MAITKVKIIDNMNFYLQGFKENEKYVAQKRAVQSNLHDHSEFTSVWDMKEKSFDTRTATSYLATLCEEARWEKRNARNFSVIFEVE